MDTELVIAAQHGDEEAFASLAIAAGGRLHAVAHRGLVVPASRGCVLPARTPDAPRGRGVVDVDGKRLTFNGRFPAATTPADRAELDAIIASIDIEPTAP